MTKKKNKISSGSLRNKKSKKKIRKNSKTSRELEKELTLIRLIPELL